MLCLAARVPHSRVVGLEMQRDLVRLAGDNVILNGLEARASVMIGDLLQPPPRLSPGAFDHVMANPPFQRARPCRARRGSRKIGGDDRGRRRSRRLGALLARDGPRQRHGDVRSSRRPDRCAARPNRRPGGRSRGFPVMAGRGQSGEPHPGSRAQAGRRLRRGSPPASYCTMPTADSRPVRKGVLREGRGLDL